MQTKTGDVRLVPLSKQVIALLNSLKSVGSADHSEYVFPSDKTKTGHISSFRIVALNPALILWACTQLERKDTVSES